MSAIHPPGACTYALRLADGRLVADPILKTASYDMLAAHLWIWPSEETPEVRARQLAEVGKRYPWLQQPLTIARAR